MGPQTRSAGFVADVLVGTSLVVLSVGVGALLRATAGEESGNDPFDSPYHWPSWGVLIASGFIAGFSRGVRPRPAIWAGVVTAPLAVGLALLGTVWHDPDQGASLWLAGEVFVCVLGALVLSAAELGRSLRARSGAPLHERT